MLRSIQNGGDFMQESVDSEIKLVREELNKLMEEGADYSKIYNVSIKLDELILNYTKKLKAM